MVEFLAILTGVQTERPIQNISFNLSAISHWIEKTLELYPKGIIAIYQMDRHLIGTAIGPGVECLCGHGKNFHLKTTSSDPSNPLGACSKLDCACKHWRTKE